MLTKRLTLEVKDADQGLVVAKFAQLNVIDHDGDVTLPGAFESGAKVGVSAYGHSAIWGDIPAGKGVIREEGDWAVADLQFFMKTASGRESFEVVKEMGDLQEWSYGYDVLESENGMHDGQRVRYLKKLNVYEVSPVLRGAGIGTETLSAKADGSTYAQDGERALAACQAFTDRSGALAALRAKEGRVLSPANRERLEVVAGGMRDALKAIDGLLAEPDEAAIADLMAREHARLTRITLTH